MFHKDVQRHYLGEAEIEEQRVTSAERESYAHLALWTGNNYIELR